MKSVAERIFQQAQQEPEKTAVVFEGDEITYGALWDASLRLSAFLRNSGVSRGDRVICQTVYSRWYVIACMACHLSGAVFVPVEKNASSEVLAEICTEVGAKCVLAKTAADSDGCWFSFDSLPDKLSRMQENAACEFPDLDAPACIMFTTGTTGRPKGAVLSHRAISANAEAYFRQGLLSAGNTFITIVPINHVAPMWRLFGHLYYGGTVIFLDGILKLKKMYAFLEQYHVTSVYLPPSAIGVISQSASAKLGQFAAQIETLGIASAGIQEAQRAFITELLPDTKIYFKYGSSESGWVSGIELHEQMKLDTSCVGKPIAGVELRLVDEAIQDVPPGEQGIIATRSAVNFSGYWNRPELTAEVMRDGWIVSSDIGWMDKDGNLYLCGRKDDVINIGGLKVFPAEIEKAALSLDGVSECICVKAPDSITGQAARLILCMRSGSTLTLADLRKSLMQQLDSYKVPKILEFADHIEKTANGKPNRKAYQ